uniref:Uncharacterized protein n=1 Tax=Sphaerodactylus townsendi TaxID=933632 RepID=A0ACB8E8K0_9SAUR
MGNAPLCQACHTGKGVNVQGNIQDVEKFTDYYGCNSEDSKEPEAVTDSTIQEGSCTRDGPATVQLSCLPEVCYAVADSRTAEQKATLWTWNNSVVALAWTRVGADSDCG